ncbi:MAG: helix-turn-helix domain-containing protein [Thermoproteota archaeon]|nr:helix-turn-helix domain-containing protein [Thermoproteota archaeon]
MMRLKQRMTDREICEAVKISRATLYRYKREIYTEDKVILTELIADNMAHEILDIVDSLHKTIENMRKFSVVFQRSSEYFGCSAIYIYYQMKICNFNYVLYYLD